MGSPWAILDLSISGFSKSSIRRHRRTFLCPHDICDMSQTCYGDKWGQDRTRMKSVFGRYEPCSHIPLCTTYHKTMIMLNLWQGNFGPSSLHLRPRDHSLCPKKMGTWDNYRAPVTFCCPDSLNGSTRLASHDLKGSSVSTSPDAAQPAPTV